MDENDRAFLRWCHERFAVVFGESPNLDWMQRLAALAKTPDPATLAAEEPAEGPHGEVVIERLDRPGNRADGARPAVALALDVERLAKELHKRFCVGMKHDFSPGDISATERALAALSSKELTE